MDQKFEKLLICIYIFEFLLLLLLFSSFFFQVRKQIQNMSNEFEFPLKFTSILKTELFLDIYSTSIDIQYNQI